MNWTVFYTVLPLIFVAALPGRTTFVMLLLATRGQPSAVFAGSAVAFLFQALISVGLGRVFALFPQYWIQLGAGLLFLFFAYGFWKMDGEEPVGESDTGPEVDTHFLKTFRSCFLVIFAAEWGDVSQVAIATLSSRYEERLTVLLSAVFALWAIAALAVYLGTHAHRLIHPHKLQKLASVVFCLMGLYLIMNGIQGYVHR